MRRINHIKKLIENINKTEEIIALHKESDDLKIISAQFEALKAKQVAELINELAMPPFQTIESFSIIQLVINKYYPSINSDTVQQKDLKELALTI